MDLRILSDEELLSLAREINLELLQRVPQSAPAAPAETPAVLPVRCAYCNGTGYKVDGEFCSCNMGRDIERATRRGLSRFSPADAKYAGPEPEWAEDDPDEQIPE